MAKVTEVATDVYEVVDFVQSMPNLRYQVTFLKGKVRVISREGCVGPEWDRHAISAAQSALILQTVLKGGGQRG